MWRLIKKCIVINDKQRRPYRDNRALHAIYIFIYQLVAQCFSNHISHCFNKWHKACYSINYKIFQESYDACRMSVAK